MWSSLLRVPQRPTIKIPLYRARADQTERKELEAALASSASEMEAPEMQRKREEAKLV